MAIKLCRFIVDGRECRQEMTEQSSQGLIGLKGFGCPLGHRAYDNIYFRKWFNDDTWHFSRDCSQWPNINYATVGYISTDDTMCNECIVKTKVN